MKKAFSLLELIFAIVVIGIISSVAIPKYLDTRNSAVASTIKRDISTATTSIQSHYLVNGEITNISDAISLNNEYWTSDEPLKVIYKEGGNNCVVLEVKDDNSSKVLSLTITPSSGPICTMLNEDGIVDTDYELF